MRPKIRVGLVGSAGVGKSTLAAELSSALGVPCLLAKSITQEILDRDAYDWYAGVQVEKFLAAAKRQEEILRKTIAQQSVGQFVTDRTFVDLAAYAVCELHNDYPWLLEKICNSCRKKVGIYTHLLVCPWGATPMKSNGKRTLNVHYQFIIYALERRLMEEWGCKFHILKSTRSKRVKEALEVIRKTNE